MNFHSRSLSLSRLRNIRNMFLISSLVKSLTNKISSSRKCVERTVCARGTAAKKTFPENVSEFCERFLRFLFAEIFFLLLRTNLRTTLKLLCWRRGKEERTTKEQRVKKKIFIFLYIISDITIYCCNASSGKNVENFQIFREKSLPWLQLFMVSFPIRDECDGLEKISSLSKLLAPWELSHEEIFSKFSSQNVKIFCGFVGHSLSTESWDKIFTFCFWCGKRLFPFSRINYPLLLLSRLFVSKH